MWYPGWGSFLLGSAVVGDGWRGSGGGVQVCAPREVHRQKSVHLERCTDKNNQ